MHRDVANHTLVATLSTLIVDSDPAQNLENVSHVISAAKNFAALIKVSMLWMSLLHTVPF